MTGNLYLDLAISLAGVGVLIAVSWLLGAWRSATVDDAAARDRLAFDEPDFRAGEWLFSADGKSAAALSDTRDEAVFIFALGDGLATRRLKTGAFPVTAQGGDIIAALGDPSKRRLKLVAADAAAAARWAGRLGGEAYN